MKFTGTEKSPPKQALDGVPVNSRYFRLAVAFSGKLCDEPPAMKV
jgi:hypothetical protein